MSFRYPHERDPGPVGFIVVRAIALGCLVLFGMLVAAPALRAEPARIVSLNPSLSAILLAIGKADRLVGIDDYSARQLPEVAGLPQVGGLFNPSLEAVVALEPDLVVLVPSAEQRDFSERIEALGVTVERFANHRFDEVIENIARLGALTGARTAAAARIAAIRSTRAQVERAVAKLARAGGTVPTIAVVLQRDPLYVVGGGNFIDTMLQITGTQNVAAAYREAYPRVSMEWLLASSPRLLVDLSPEARQTMDFWQQWPNLAAVKRDRLMALDAGLISLPGPALDQSLLLLAQSFWGGEIMPLLAEAQP